MITNSSEAIAAIETRGYPAIFKQIYEGNQPTLLQGECAPPQIFFRILPELRHRIHWVENYLPLWETNGDYVVAYDSSRDIYIRYYFGDPDDELLGKTYQQFVTAYLLELIDAGLGDNLDSLATSFHYKHTALLKQFAESEDDPDYANANRRFIDSIPD